MFRNDAVGNMPNQFGGSKDTVSWKEQEVKVPANGLVTVHFDGTKPNQFLIENPSNAILHVGITKIPSADTYEHKVQGNASKTFGRPVATDRLYILNKGNVDTSVHLFSVYDKFDMSILQNMNIEVGDVNAFDGIIKGFGAGVPLPQGSNHIGEVSVRRSDAMAVLLADSTNAGATNLYSLLYAMNEWRAKWVETLEAMNTKLDNMKVSAVSGLMQKVLSYQGTDVEESTMISFDGEEVKPCELKFISNDGNTDIDLSVIKDDEVGFQFVLKPDEVLTDINMEISTIHMMGTEPYSYRILVGVI